MKLTNRDYETRAQASALAAKDMEVASLEAEIVNGLAENKRLRTALEASDTLLGQVIADTAAALGCPSDNEKILEAVDTIRAALTANDQRVAALEAALRLARPAVQTLAQLEAEAAKLTPEWHWLGVLGQIDKALGVS